MTCHLHMQHQAQHFNVDYISSVFHRIIDVLIVNKVDHSTPAMFDHFWKNITTFFLQKKLVIANKKQNI